MTKLDRIDLQRIVMAAVCAIVLSTASIGAAVGPARTAEIAAA